MISTFVDPGNGKITSLSFCYNDICIPNIKVFTAHVYRASRKRGEDLRDELEWVRKEKQLEVDAEMSRKVKDEYGKGIRNTHYSPSHVLKLHTSVPFINDLLNEIFQKIIVNDPVDISKSFSKAEGAPSVTEKRLGDDVDESYRFNVEGIPGIIEELLIIDDAFNQGRTLNQLLIRMAQSGIINNETKISVFALYGFLKSRSEKNCNC